MTDELGVVTKCYTLTYNRAARWNALKPGYKELLDAI